MLIMLMENEDKDQKEIYLPFNTNRQLHSITLKYKSGCSSKI